MDYAHGLIDGTGGGLESPAEKFGSTVGKLAFFHKFPYVLPNMVISAIALISAFTTILFVNEVNQSSLAARRIHILIIHQTLHIHRGNKETAGPPLSTWQLLKSPGVARVLVISNYVMLLAFTFTAVFPVFQYTPVELGGLGFTPGLIAAVTGLNGVSQAVFLLLIFSKLHKHFGTIGILWTCAVAWPIFFALCPMFHVMLEHHLDKLLWWSGPPILVVGSGVAMAFSKPPVPSLLKSIS